MRALVFGGIVIGFGMGFGVPSLTLMLDGIGKRDWFCLAIYALSFLVCIAIVVTGTFIVKMRNVG